MQSLLYLSRFGAALGSHLRGLCFECQGAFPFQRRMPSARIVVAIDVFEDGHFSFVATGP